MENVLFLMDKYCDGRPEFGLTTHFHHFIESFAKYQSDYNLHTIHYDELSLLSGVHIDKILANYCQRFNIRIIFICFRGQDPVNPSINSLIQIKQLGVFVSVIWLDNNDCDIKLRNKLSHIIDLNISIDNPRKDDGSRLDQSEILYLWTPQSQNLYYPDEQDIDVSFIGSSRYQERKIYLSYISEKIPDFYLGGGQRETAFSPEKYASLIRRSKIGVNFSRNPMGIGYQQTKGRVFEIIGSKSLLIEEVNCSVRDFLEPGKDYIEFFNAEDLVDKIKYYRYNTEERIKIAESGYNKFINNYTGKHFWNKINYKINELKK